MFLLFDGISPLLCHFYSDTLMLQFYSINTKIKEFNNPTHKRNLTFPRHLSIRQAIRYIHNLHGFFT